MIKTAMILAAGRGERLRPLTDTIPKPLIEVGGKRLIEYHIEKLANVGITNIVINTAWLGEQIQNILGDGSIYNVSIRYSDEGNQALETAGGIIKALPLLGNEPFIIVNGDIWTDYDFSVLVNSEINAEAHVVLVKNPVHNEDGDFAIENGYLTNFGETMYTYSGIGIYIPEFFKDEQQGKAPLGPILRGKCEQNNVTAELHDAQWTDVGTMDRLDELSRKL